MTGIHVLLEGTVYQCCVFIANLGCFWSLSETYFDPLVLPQTLSELVENELAP
jgi:hypothetical protein